MPKKNLIVIDRDKNVHIKTNKKTRTLDIMIMPKQRMSVNMVHIVKHKIHYTYQIMVHDAPRKIRNWATLNMIFFMKDDVKLDLKFSAPMKIRNREVNVRIVKFMDGKKDFKLKSYVTPEVDKRIFIEEATVDMNQIEKQYEGMSGILMESYHNFALQDEEEY